MAITDVFTGTNGNSLPTYSANWAYVIGSGTTMQIQSNAVALTNALGDAQLACQRTETTFPGNHYAQIVVTATSDTAAVSGGPAVRCQGSGTSNFYGFYVAGNASYLFSNSGLVWTQLGSPGSPVSLNDVLKLTVSGTTLTPNVNGSTTGTPGAQTDATFSNGAPGVCGYNNAQVTSTMRMDSFESSDVSAGGATWGPLLGLANNRLVAV